MMISTQPIDLRDSPIFQLFRKTPCNIASKKTELPLAAEGHTHLSKSLKYTGLLNSYQSSDSTPTVGREYHGLQIGDLLNAKTGDALVCDLAMIVSQRRVVILRDQGTAPSHIARDLAKRLSVLTGYLEHSGLHVLTGEGSGLDGQISVISNTEKQRGDGLEYLFDFISRNNDAQVRFKLNKNDLVIWDNRMIWHTTTHDGSAERDDDRICSLEEKSFPGSAS